MKTLKALLIVLILSLIPFFSFADNAECNVNMFQIVGNESTKTALQNNFFVEGRDPAIDTQRLDIVWNIKKNGENVFTYTGSNLDYVFKTSGPVSIESNFQFEGCEINHVKDLYVYQKVHLYVGKQSDIEIFNMIEQFRDKDELFTIIEDNQLEKIKNYISLLEKADNIIISQDASSQFLDILYKYQDIYEFDISSKKIYVLAGSGKQFTKKILVKYLSFLKLKTIHIIRQYDFWNLMGYILKEDESAIKNISEELSIDFSGGNKFLFMSYFTDALILNGFSMEVLGLILTTSVIVLLIAFFRQVIGFSVFGLYNPLLFAIACVIGGVKISLILFTISILATIVTRMFTKKIYLLYSAKISLLYLLYIILFIIGVGGIYIFFPWLLHSINFSDVIVVMLVIIMPIVTNKILGEGSNIRSLGFWVFLLEFAMLELILYYIFQNTLLTNMMIAYPDIILLFVLLNILIGRFTGLQVLEYLRFAPLIKKLYEEEE